MLILTLNEIEVLFSNEKQKLILILTIKDIYIYEIKTRYKKITVASRIFQAFATTMLQLLVLSRSVFTCLNDFFSL